MTASLAIASLNVHGVPFSRPPATVRAARIGELASRMDLDVLCVQELHTYPVLRALAAGLGAALPYPAHVPGAGRPAGGLVTFTRDPAARVTFRPLPGPGGQPDRRLRRLLNAERRKGLLVTELAGGAGTVINLHLSPNRDGDWSPGSRYAPLHQAQLAAVGTAAAAARAGHGPAVVTGDFNVAKDSELFAGFTARSGLADAFAGQAPATFRTRPDMRARCIDHLLFRPGAGPLAVAESSLAFDAEQPWPDGTAAFLSDHLGLLVRLGPPAGRP